MMIVKAYFHQKCLISHQLHFGLLSIIIMKSARCG